MIVREKSCGALVIRKNDTATQMLLIKHKHGGHWSFPKGHVEGAETEVETALREVKEETGLDIKLINGYKEKVYYSPRVGIKKEVVYFLGKSAWVEAIPQEEEISETRWFDIDSVLKQVTFENDKRLIKHALKVIRKSNI